VTTVKVLGRRCGQGLHYWGWVTPAEQGVGNVRSSNNFGTTDKTTKTSPFFPLRFVFSLRDQSCDTGDAQRGRELREVAEHRMWTRPRIDESQHACCRAVEASGGSAARQGSPKGKDSISMCIDSWLGASDHPKGGGKCCGQRNRCLEILSETAISVGDPSGAQTPEKGGKDLWAA
jgi:hypothetical protein